jgi:hypothetical protein
MPRYRDLGTTGELKATPDQTGRNQGNWTIVADPQVLNCKVGLAEVSQITIDGPIGAALALWRNQQCFNRVVQGWANNYDPQNPLFIRPGDSLFFFWNAKAGVWLPAPTCSIWLRYDLDLPENQPNVRQP